MSETLRQVPPSECGQLNGQASCRGCPVYLAANRISEGFERGTIEQVKEKCPPGATMQPLQPTEWRGWAGKIGSRW